ncbi:protocatechuate 3,4-dioxygenase subunit alpha [Flexivirga endophytica]|uniref:Protocatechuate 3,4-dioxygenase subunit alpha n=1 Tax=Flexivirga endophytica TaxID=1849103 RepID=A0A916TBR8_9MICO|nr:protocatechuate 3,4-dioxygenase subunit alpha [Flexivirga endophytica]GGB37578.1 protocatechuate 3,4-dioxygenase subunit alpha [Flexivirga endophytica]GHB45107.1 protocatechuate 3,4-dioxygenase subunit alpha [Flexivirga endophytica]
MSANRGEDTSAARPGAEARGATARMSALHPTPGQTVGPFFGYALPYDGGGVLVPVGHPHAIRLHGTVYDGDGEPIPDALIEIWQADENGAVAQDPGSRSRDGWTFTGFGRVAVDPDGHYSFTTVPPGVTRGDGAPFFAVTVFARGLLHRLLTRAYLPLDDAVAAVDPFLSSVPANRRGTLVTRADEHGLVFDIHLQGADETVFLTYGEDQ